MSVGLETADVLADRVLARTSSQAAVGVVDVDDPVVRVRQCDHDGLARRVEYLAGQLETLVSPPLFRHILKGDELRGRPAGADDERRDPKVDVAEVVV